MEKDGGTLIRLPVNQEAANEYSRAGT